MALGASATRAIRPYALIQTLPIPRAPEYRGTHLLVKSTADNGYIVMVYVAMACVLMAYFVVTDILMAHLLVKSTASDGSSDGSSVGSTVDGATVGAGVVDVSDDGAGDNSAAGACGAVIGSGLC